MRITAHQKQDEPELIEAPPGLYEELIIKSVLMRVFLSHLRTCLCIILRGKYNGFLSSWKFNFFFAAKIICFWPDT